MYEMFTHSLTTPQFTYYQLFFFVLSSLFYLNFSHRLNDESEKQTNKNDNSIICRELLFMSKQMEKFNSCLSYVHPRYPSAMLYFPLIIQLMCLSCGISGLLSRNINIYFWLKMLIFYHCFISKSIDKTVRKKNTICVPFASVTHK